jgi:hypothetical protein
MENQKIGFKPLAVLLIIAGIIVLVGAYYIGYRQGSTKSEVSSEAQNNETTVTSATSGSSASGQTNTNGTKTPGSSVQAGASACGKTITVSSPTNGQKIELGDKVRVTWHTNFTVQNVQLQMETYMPTFKNPKVSYILTNEIPNNGLYQWLIGSHQDGPGGPGTSTPPGKYILKVRASILCNNAAITGVSAPFEIVN